MTENLTGQSTCPACTEPVHWSAEYSCWVHETVAGIISCPDPYAIDDMPAPIGQMIAELDSLPDLSDGTDPRTWREVYDAGLVTDDDVRHMYFHRTFSAHAQAGVEAIREASK